VIREETELILGEMDGSKGKVVDNATNMTDVDLGFEIEEIEVLVSQVSQIFSHLAYPGVADVSL